MHFNINAKDSEGLSDIDSLTIRLMKRDTNHGDVETLVKGKGLTVSKKEEIAKAGCNRIWDKTCWEKKSTEHKISKANFIKLRDLISVNRIMDIKSGKHPAPGEIQYSIGILLEGQKPVYINLTEKEAEKNKKYGEVVSYITKL